MTLHKEPNGLLALTGLARPELERICRLSSKPGPCRGARERLAEATAEPANCGADKLLFSLVYTKL